ncbi:hypothetical protein CW751_11740 [Brumimicrobium salinarum]|uniref:Uncharacterized protein n=1 Tax=Brumimicrobium salinarum TaxID=2058658 RepID=A0A2I0R0C9_9FLAO|nr:hypothetical protein [Brumimicrobium salinarum]PKR80034.1 hypothetical protein CW751_11740 [Brumimicrobium salinarum]
MVLIISENFDPSTNDVIDWLIHYSVDYYRVNMDDDVSFKVCIDYSEVFQEPQYSFQHDKTKIYLSDLTAVWYRRGGFPLTIDVNGLSFEGLGGDAPDQLKDSLRLENRALLNTFYKKLGRLKNVNILGRRETGTLNKLDVLDLAYKLGVNIPRYIICTDRKQALDFYKSCDGKVIGKAIHENPLFYDDSNRVFTSFVERISLNDINGMADTFMPSLLQEEIVKDIEIRTFF